MVINTKNIHLELLKIIIPQIHEEYNTHSFEITTTFRFMGSSTYIIYIECSLGLKNILTFSFEEDLFTYLNIIKNKLK